MLIKKESTTIRSREKASSSKDRASKTEIHNADGGTREGEDVDFEGEVWVEMKSDGG